MNTHVVRDRARVGNARGEGSKVRMTRRGRCGMRVRMLRLLLGVARGSLSSSSSSKSSRLTVPLGTMRLCRTAEDTYSSWPRRKRGVGVDQNRRTKTRLHSARRETQSNSSSKVCASATPPGTAKGWTSLGTPLLLLTKPGTVTTAATTSLQRASSPSPKCKVRTSGATKTLAV